MTHATGDRGQRWEVSFFNPTTNARQVYGWTNDQAAALRMADSVEKHPSWCYPQVNDRHAVTTQAKRTTLCWNCNTEYPMVDMQCQSCGATNANRDPETAAIEVRAKTKTPNAEVRGD